MSNLNVQTPRHLETSSGVLPTSTEKMGKLKALGHTWQQLNTGQKVTIVAVSILTASIALVGFALFGLSKLSGKYNKSQEGKNPLEKGAIKTEKQGETLGTHKQEETLDAKKPSTESEINEDFIVPSMRGHVSLNPVQSHSVSTSSPTDPPSQGTVKPTDSKIVNTPKAPTSPSTVKLNRNGLIRNEEVKLNMGRMGVAIRKNLLEDNPMLVLDHIANGLDNTPTIPRAIEVKFLDEKGVPTPGLDAGGLTSQFLSVLTTSVVNKLFPNGRIPHSQTEQDKSRMRAFGFLIRLAAIHGSPVGKIFPAPIYHALTMLGKGSKPSDSEKLTLQASLSQDATEGRLMLILATPVDKLSDQDLMFLRDNLVLEDDNNVENLNEETPIENLREKSQEIRDNMASCFLEGRDEFTNRTPEEIRGHLLDQANKDEKIVSLGMISQGLYSQFGKREITELRKGDDALQTINDRADALSDLDPKELQGQVEGFITAEEILNRLKINGESQVGHMLSQWLKEQDEDMLKKFVFAVTGAMGLKEDNIRLEVTENTRTLIAFHTCNDQIDIDIKNLEKFCETKQKENPELKLQLFDVFKERMEFCIEEALKGNFEIQ